MGLARTLVNTLPPRVQRFARARVEQIRDLKRASNVRELMKQVEMVSPPCAICGGYSVRPHHVYNGFKIVRCQHDGLIFVSPRPKDLAPFYGQNYYAGDMVGGYGDYAAHAQGYRAKWSERLAILGSANGGVGSLLDVGCAMGDFLSLAREHEWAVSGIELSDWASAQARDRGLNVLQGSLPDDRLPSASFDVVTIFDCMEHLSDPEAVLRDIHRLIRPNGHLTLTTGALVHQDPQRESKWYYPPWHLYYFSEETIKALLAKCGFEVISYEEEDQHIPEYALMVVLARPIHPAAAAA